MERYQTVEEGEASISVVATEPRFPVAEFALEPVVMSVPHPFRYLRWYRRSMFLDTTSAWHTFLPSRIILLGVVFILHALPVTWIAYLTTVLETTVPPSCYLFISLLQALPWALFITGGLRPGPLRQFDALLAQEEKKSARLETYRKVVLRNVTAALVITGVVTVVFLGWMFHYVFLQGSKFSVVAWYWKVSAVLMATTALYRISSVLVFTSSFSVMCAYLKMEFTDFVNDLPSSITVAEVMTRHQALMDQTRAAFAAWQWVLGCLVGIPLTSFVLLIYEFFAAAPFMLANWFFIVYCVYELSLAAYTLALLAHGSAPMRHLPKDIANIACEQKVALQGTAAQVRALHLVLDRQVHKIEVLRVPVDWSTLAVLAYGTASAIVAIVQSVLAGS